MLLRRLWPAVGRLIAALMVGFVLLVGLAGRASAHNSLEGSDPPDGASLTEAPSQLTLRFSVSTPLNTVGLDLIGSTGVRQALANFAHGATDQEVVVPLPAGLGGAVTLRWRLVGSDGHVVSGRVSFTVPVPATTPITAPSVGPEQPVRPGGVVEPAPVDPFTTPAAVRWLMRLGALGGLILVSGGVLVSAYVWPGVIKLRLFRLAVAVAVGAIGVLAVGQVLILASDVSGRSPLDAWEDLAAAARTDAGAALLVRALVVGLLAYVLFGWRRASRLSRAVAAGVCLVALLATWGYAGHGRSMRWPWLGVPLDMVHHGAAAAWLGGLVLMVAVVGRQANGEALVLAARRFSRVAGVAVMVVIVTGTLQAVRLVGGPSGLADTAHGRLLAFKLVALGAMLYVADVNRRRVNRRFTSVTTATRGAEIALRRAMTTESVLGLGILMVTAALVVSPPATSRHRVQEVGSDRTEVAALDRQLTSGSGTIRVKVDEARLGARTTLHVTPIEPKAETVHVQARPVREPDRSTALDLRPQGGTFSAELPLTVAGGWRLQIVVDGNQADPYVATMAVRP